MVKVNLGLFVVIVALGAPAIAIVGCQRVSSADQDDDAETAPSARVMLKNTVPQPRGAELTEADWVDGKRGSYHIVKVEVYEKASHKEADEQTAAQILVTLSPQANVAHPDAKYEVVGEDLSQIDEGQCDLSMNFDPPFAISRKNGKIDSDFLITAKFYGGEKRYPNENFTGTDAPHFPTLDQIVKDAEKNSSGSVRFYKAEDGDFEIRYSIQSALPDGELKGDARAVYKFVAE